MGWVLLGYLNYLIRNNFVEFVKNVMGHSFVEYPRCACFMCVAFTRI